MIRTTLLALALVLVIATPAQASSVYQGRILVGSPIIALGDACQEPGTEGISSNCVAIAPGDAGLPIVGLTIIASTPCLIGYGLRFYDAAGEPLDDARVGDSVPAGAASLAVSFSTTSCVDFTWEIAFGFE